jgi:hypothetical protein
MNIVEAIKSGCKFKRKSYDPDMWCHVTKGTDGCKEVQFVTGQCKRFLPYEGDLLADDWEIQEPNVTITRTEFWEAASLAFGFTFEKYAPLGAVTYTGPAAPPVMQVASLARRLGLEGEK